MARLQAYLMIAMQKSTQVLEMQMHVMQSCSGCQPPPRLLQCASLSQAGRDKLAAATEG